MKATRGNEFNFSSYIEEIKQRMNNFIANVVNKRSEYGDDVEIIVDKRGYQKPTTKNKEHKHHDKKKTKHFEQQAGCGLHYYSIHIYNILIDR